MEGNKNKIILDLCGGTGSWSKPYKDAGYDVEVITLPQFDIREAFMRGDGYFMFPMAKQYRDTLLVNRENVYGILAAPPCTKFTFADWRTPLRERSGLGEATALVRKCLDIIWEVQKRKPIWWALENPVGHLYKFLGQPAFTFQGWEMAERGTGRTKRYAIWGYFNPPAKLVKRRPKNLPPTRHSHKDWYSPPPPVWLKGKKLSRSDLRAITPHGFAQAFFEANQ